MEASEKSLPKEERCARYLEISRAEFVGNVDQFLGIVAPPGLNRGTDRLDPSVTSRYDILYQTDAKKAGVDPLDVMDVMNGADLRRYLPTIINPPDVTHLASTALLVYACL